MTIHFRETPGKIIVSFTDAQPLDVQEAGKKLFEICQRAADAAKKLIVDFSGVQFMSSAMIGVLVLLNKMAKHNALDVRLANANRNILEVFRITRLNKVFRIDDDDDGLSSARIPLPKPPGTLDGGATPPS